MRGILQGVDPQNDDTAQLDYSIDNRAPRGDDYSAPQQFQDNGQLPTPPAAGKAVIAPTGVEIG